MANEDMTQYLGVFLDEANEQLTILERDILELETGAKPELLQEIFRAAHTLKGSSRAMGFISMGELTHAMEDIFDRLRNKALTVTKPIVDALFDALDLLKKQVEEVAVRGEPETDSTELTSRLRAVIEDEPRTPDETSPARMGHQKSTAPPFRHEELSLTARASAMEAKQAGENIFALTIRLADDCVMKSVRALMVMQSLESIGSVLTTTPGEEQIENEEFGQEFGIILATARSAEEIERVAKATSEVADVRVESLEISPAVPSLQTPDDSPAKKPTRPETSIGVAAYASSETGIKAPKKLSLPTSASVSQTVRVDVVRLDNLLNLVGELVIDQTRIAQVAADLGRKYGGEPLLDSLAEATAHVGRITSMLQAEIMKARMLPIDNLFNRFPRMMRDLGQKLG
ncbi:MAG TPA: Hpt domain-containing protein, partial [Chthonomonadales bacterium]|nr:Hpt domain-containing protein [Chthonomonadales bacterium]